MRPRRNVASPSRGKSYGRNVSARRDGMTRAARVLSSARNIDTRVSFAARASVSGLRRWSTIAVRGRKRRAAVVFWLTYFAVAKRFEAGVPRILVVDDDP